MEWKHAAFKLKDMFRDRCDAIRSDLDPDRFVACTRDSLVGASVPESPSDGVGQDPGFRMDLLMALVMQINSDHRARIRSLAGGIGVIMGELDSEHRSLTVDFSGNPVSVEMHHDGHRAFRFLGEDDSSVLVLVENMVVRVDKDMLTKILTLGGLP